jgi:hypothetical protein
MNSCVKQWRKDKICSFKICLIAGNSLESLIPKCNNLKNWTISSEVPYGKRSTTREKSRTKIGNFWKRQNLVVYWL